MGARGQGRPVAVIGAGAVGTSVASALARAGRPVTVCGASRRIERIEVTEDGSTETWPVAQATVPDDITGYDTAVLAVKAHQTDAAAAWLKAVSAPGTTVLVAQNGVEQRERVAPHTDGAYVVPAVVYLNAERTAPGRATLRRVGRWDLVLPDEAPARALAAELSAGLMRVGLEADFATVAWAKLLGNITANPLTALTGRRVDVLRDPGIGTVARLITDEAVRVARAEGAALSAAHAREVLAWLENAPEGATTSMLQDRIAGRPLEYDALTGAVVRAAERHGIDVPVNRLILALTSAIHPGQ
ncbi:2-dehydropantoate 2-reductase [Nocardiopsis sp. CC223A]|uniref:2-dehydropantoate 2-reductase n=1 Tax=Nocardiopsis sp. CC223A TaxID=3044051 RepID=UPI002795CFED|nr:2-dehydropantoate 2-reductase [Nocardiopsis sp. CC223A]